jgi:Fe-S cluster assembly protein SufB
MSADTKPVFADLSRTLFDTPDSVGYRYEAAPGLSPELIRHISATYGEPAWMLEHRLKCYDIFRAAKIPTWGPDLSGLDLESIRYFARAEEGTGTKSWDEVPEKIKNTFERLGIPEAERRMLAGAGAQYDSEAVYHSLREDLREQGVIFEDMSTALLANEELVRRHFMRAVTPYDHAFAALHGAVWSGGTFLYVPR